MTGTDAAVRELELADRAMTDFDVDAAVTHLSAAVRGFTAANDCRRAALTCARLGALFADYVGNNTAARAWFLRATRLVENEPPCIEQGWVAVAALGCDVDDPAILLTRAELALERARRFGDVNLETKALADAGLAHVQAGRIDQGMAMLDEAMALTCGPADDPAAAGRSMCSFFTACYYAADFERADSWAQVFRRQGLIGTAAGAPVILANHCDAVHATLLCELGRWGEAEALLARAMEEIERAMHMPSWHPAIALAELRIRQGRLADAEALLLGKEGHFQALLPATRLHLARGDYDLARATAVRGLRAIGVDRLPPSGVELLRALLLVDLVRLHDAMDDQASASVEAKRAAAALADLDVVLALDDVAVLDRYGAAGPVTRGSSEGAGSGGDALTRTAVRTAVLIPEDRGWVATCGETRARMTDTKGLRYLAELLRGPGVERHVLDLVDRVEGVAPADMSLDRRRLGDAGEMVDAKARTAYRHRIEELRSDIDLALEMGHEDRAEDLQTELDQLVGQLANAFGLGGRGRRASSVPERARLNVTRALRAAIARLSDVLPEAGDVLDRRIRTGLYCAYEPVGADEVRWVVHSEVNGAGRN